MTPFRSRLKQDIIQMTLISLPIALHMYAQLCGKFAIFHCLGMIPPTEYGHLGMIPFTNLQCHRNEVGIIHPHIKK